MTKNRLGSLFFTSVHLSTALLFFAGIFSALPEAEAQWNPSFNAPDRVSCIRWLQDEGARLTPPQPLLHKGVCGGGAGSGTQFISYCLSNNTNWISANIAPPGLWNDGYISDFAFKDTMTGWASVYGASP